MNKLKIFIPSIIYTILFIILVPIRHFTYGITYRFISNMIYAYLTILSIPLIDLIFKIKIPLIINYLLSLQAFMALSIGSAFEVYTILSYYDKFVHAFFGIDAFLFGYFCLVRWNVLNIKLVPFLLIMLMIAMGMASIWEIIEYTIDLITGSDCQHVINHLPNKSPIYDTMTDIISTLFMTLFLDILLLIDKLFGYKVMNYLYKSFKKD